MTEKDEFPWETVPEDDSVISPVYHRRADQARREKSKLAPNKYSNELKLEIILETLKGEISQNQLSKHYDISQAIISLWRKAAIKAIQTNLECSPKRGRKPNRDDAAFDHLLNAADRELFERLRTNLADALGMVDLILKYTENKAPGKDDVDHGHS